MSKWILVNEFGPSRCYLDESSIQKNKAIVGASLKYKLEPPGKDKTTDKDVKEMLMFEEYDLDKNVFRVTKMEFVYTDGTTSESRFQPKLEWAPATAGNMKTLACLRQILNNLTESEKQD